jgi:Uma2 family endonuclease
MSAAAPHHVFTYREYLEREQETGLKHEFLHGQVFAMAGGTPEHARLIAAVTIALGRMLDSQRCRIFSSELKVRVKATGLATYPDVTVICGEAVRDDEDPNALANPKVIVEVLSASTEACGRRKASARGGDPGGFAGGEGARSPLGIDRGEKWAHYRRLESLEAYVLVSQIPERVEIYERIPQGRENAGAFLHRVAARGEHLPIACLAASLDVDELYRGAL